MLKKIFYRAWNERLKAERDIVLPTNRNSIQTSKVKYTTQEIVEFSKNGLNEIGSQHSYFIGKGTFVLPEQYFFLLRKSFLIGEQAIPIDSEGRIYTETVFTKKELLSKANPRKLIRYKLIKNERIIPKAISLVNIYVQAPYYNYFHWVVDCLPLLQAVQHDLGNVIVIINKNPKQFQIDSLQLLGVAKENIMEWNYEKALIKELIVPQFRRVTSDLDDLFSPLAINWLRNSIFRGVDLTPRYHTKVYISRSKNSFRKVVNEAEIDEMLSAKGFFKYYLEDMSFSDQVNLFYNADVIISPHGASMTNLIFMSEKSKVIELLFLNEGYWYSLYYLLAAAIGVKYTFLKCEEFNYIRNQKFDLKVDPTKLLKLINSQI
ncbi:glycosyltransferase family 61 protein [Fulvivirga maritima]|uniref:glycosyltransferase family 61 protein n=1 Tax=Fulvivirga maritima TaxID=2904247 RepID=UPI001F441210|nr:glycosyltransferase family 61 protein [Fulvivirga maritima]UII27787.1 glycosyltransferase family 61 protein [Fulvivirga maritima]